eukprot:tig00000821_g4520.t1
MRPAGRGRGKKKPDPKKEWFESPSRALQPAGGPSSIGGILAYDSHPTNLVQPAARGPQLIKRGDEAEDDDIFGKKHTSTRITQQPGGSGSAMASLITQAGGGLPPRDPSAGAKAGRRSHASPTLDAPPPAYGGSASSGASREGSSEGERRGDYPQHSFEHRAPIAGRRAGREVSPSGNYGAGLDLGRGGEWPDAHVHGETGAYMTAHPSQISGPMGGRQSDEAPREMAHVKVSQAPGGASSLNLGWGGGGGGGGGGGSGPGARAAGGRAFQRDHNAGSIDLGWQPPKPDSRGPSIPGLGYTYSKGPGAAPGAAGSGGWQGAGGSHPSVRVGAPPGGASQLSLGWG